MTKISWVAFAAAALVVCAACASESSHVKPTPAWAQGKKVKEGTVFSVSEDRLSLFDPKWPDRDGMVLKLTSSTSYANGTTPMDRAGIEEGAPVRVYFDETGPEPTAVRIEVLSAKPRR